MFDGEFRVQRNVPKNDLGALAMGAVVFGEEARMALHIIVEEK